MKISFKSIMFFLIMLYPILPVNLYIGPFSYSNLCSIMIIGLYFLTVKEKKIINIFKHDLFFWIYLIVYAVFVFLSNSYLVGIAWVFSTILVALVIIDIIRNENDFNKLINMIILSSVILSIIGIFEAFSHMYLIQGNLLRVSENIRYGILRATGPFGICINFGIYQAISAIIIFYKMANSKVKSNIKLKIAYGLAVLSVFLSVSRLAICLFIATQAILYFQLGPKKAIKNICIGVIAISIIIIVFDAIGFSSFTLISDFWVSFCNLIGINISTDTSNVVGFGNRTDLYAWVLNSLDNDILFGKGVNSEFAYKMTSFYTKTSIEVHYLNILYHCGIFGLLFLILNYLNTIKYFYNNSKNYNLNTDKISFSKLLLIIITIYCICLFGIQETDLTRFYCELVALGIVYNRINRNKNLGA